MKFVQISTRGFFGMVAAAFACAAAAQAPGAGTLTLAAVAGDVPAAVFKDAQGILHRVAAGESLPGDAWRLTRVRDGAAVITATQRLEGSDVTMTLSVGQRVTADATAAIGRAAAPQRATNYTVVPAKTVTPNRKTRNAREGQ